MRRVVFVLLIVAFAGGAAAQTYRSRAPRFERLIGERLRIGPYASARERSLVFPCQPAGQGCTSNPLDAGRIVFEGPAEAWNGYQVCWRTAAGDTCVPFERVFGAPPR